MYFFTYKKNFLKINLNLFLFRYIRFKFYIYMFFFKRLLFYTPFNRFRFKKVKRFAILKNSFLNKKLNKKSKINQVIFSKKNVSNISLKKKLLKKSLYTNKFFKSKNYWRTRHRIVFKSNKRFKKKTIHTLNKFFIKYIENERQFFIKMFSLKHKNQKSTTKFALMVHKYNPLRFKKFIELSVLNVLMRSKLALSKSHSKNLIDLKLIYINQALVTRPFKLLKKGDVLQVTYLNSFFFFYKYSYNLVYKRLSKLNYLAWRIQSSKKKKNKQHIKSFPNWLGNIFFFPHSLPRYLEVDFSSLTLTLISEPVYIRDFSPYIYWNFNYYFYKIMSWKWIT